MNTNTESAFIHEGSGQQTPPSFSRRVRQWLFPNRYCPPPRLGVEARDLVTIRTSINLNWRDRIRALLTGRMVVETRTATEFFVGHNHTTSVVEVKPPTWMDC